MSLADEHFAVIVPYRNREYNLIQLILNLQWYLEGSSFDIVIVEQADDLPFNRGFTLNVGFQLARNTRRYSHYVFHDVDLIPQQADYSFPSCPVHLCATASQFLYETPYDDCFGGVVLFNQQDFEAVNGFSNHYWGWGREDYDLRCRCVRAGLTIQRRPGRFISLPHTTEADRQEVWTKNFERFNLLQTRDFREDGLTSLEFDIVRSAELSELQLGARRKVLATPIRWASVLLRGTDILHPVTDAHECGIAQNV